MNINVKLVKSPRKNKKLRMLFLDPENQLVHYTDFGADTMSDFTLHRDEQRKQRFLQRFRKLIETTRTDPTNPMTLSRMILWSKKTLKESFEDYKQHFGFL